MSQFLMIFNMEDNHVGMKSIKKTELPILDIMQQWLTWSEYNNNFFYKKIDITLIIIISSILFASLIIIVGFLVWRAFKKSELRKSQEMNKELKEVNEENNNNIVY